MHLRDYQLAAVNAMNRALEKHKRVLITASTGSGKSLIIAEACRQASGRVLVLCHQAEILEQNARALHALSGEVASIYCAGLESKCLKNRVVIAHRDSLARIPNMGGFETVIIDECHLLSNVSGTRYQNILAWAQPEKVIGLTATPYRLQGGKIYGKNRYFDVQACNIGVRQLISRGYLCDYEVIDCDPIFEASDIATVGGDFDPKALDAKATSKAIIQGSVAAIQKHTGNGNLGIIFATGKGHARAVQEALGMEQCGYIDGETRQDRRERMISEMRAGDSSYKWVVNIGCLTTGVDIPRIDSIIMLRPTQSAGLWVQMVGRGLRVHTSKSKLKILELTDNFSRFGSIDSPMLFGSAKPPADDIVVGGDAPPEKECPDCGMMVGNATRQCPHCDHMFLKRREEYHGNDVLELPVLKTVYQESRTRAGAPCFIVTFTTQVGDIKEWLLIASPHDWQRTKAIAKLKRLRSDKVTMIRATGLNETFPKVLSYHTAL